MRQFVGHSNVIDSASFSPDGKYIATANDDGTAQMWDVDYHTTMQSLCSVLKRDFTAEERAEYGITDDLPTCPAKP